MKKIISLALVFAICFTLGVPAFASDIIENKIQAEIQQEETRIFDSVYAQLEEQDALGLLDIYKEILTPKIEANVRAQYSSSTSIKYTYSLPNGGTIGYAGYANGEVLDVFFTPQQYRDYCKGSSSYPILTFSVGVAITKIAESIGKAFATEIGGWGFVFSALMALQSKANEMAQQSVDDAGGYAEIINVSANGGTETGSTVIGWDNPPFAIVTTDYPYSIKIVRFE